MTYYIVQMNIKIEYKGKVHKLAPGLKTLEDIINDVKSRYPKQFPSGIALGFSNNGVLTQINTFAELEEMARKQGGGSLKLRVFEKGKDLDMTKELSEDLYERKLSKDQTCVFEFVDLGPEDTHPAIVEPSKDIIKKIDEKIQVVQQVKEKTQALKSQSEEKPKEEEKNEPIKEQKPEKVEKVPQASVPVAQVVPETKPAEVSSSILPQNPAIVPETGAAKLPEALDPSKPPSSFRNYSCFFCKTSGLSSNGSVCQICQGEKSFGENHPFIAFIDEIMADRFKVLLEKGRLNTKAQEKIIMPETKPTLPLIEKKQPEQTFSFDFKQIPQNKVTVRNNSEFVWKIDIVNNGKAKWPRRVYVFQIFPKSHSQVLQIPSLSPGQATNVDLGFKAMKFNTVEFYELRLGYYDLFDGVVFFGPKFGFQLETTQNLKIYKPYESKQKLKKKIEQACKYVIDQKHPVSYLADRIIELKLGTDLSLEILVDLIASLQ